MRQHQCPQRAYLGDAELTTQEYSNVSAEKSRIERGGALRMTRGTGSRTPKTFLSALYPLMFRRRSLMQLTCRACRPCHRPPVPKRARTPSLPRSTGGGQKNDSSVRSLVSSWRRRNIKMMFWPVLWHPRRHMHGCRMTRVGDDLEDLPYSDRVLTLSRGVCRAMSGSPLYPTV